jgi:hypothetical protein
MRALHPSMIRASIRLDRRYAFAFSLAFAFAFAHIFRIELTAQPQKRRLEVDPKEKFSLL